MKARCIAGATAIAILFASAFPPFQIMIGNRIVGMGYSFLFSPPIYGASKIIGSVDLGTLFAEYVGILAIGALAWLFATSMPAASKTGAMISNQATKMKWGRLKTGAASLIVIVAAIVGWAFIKGAFHIYFHPPSKAIAHSGAMPSRSESPFFEQFAKSQPGDISSVAGFDIAGALKAGYSEAEVADYLGGIARFDVAAARRAGHSDRKILSHLSFCAYGKAPTEEPNTSHAPSLGEFLARARPENPGVSDSALTEYWTKNYSDAFRRQLREQ